VYPYRIHWSQPTNWPRFKFWKGENRQNAEDLDDFAEKGIAGPKHDRGPDDTPLKRELRREREGAEGAEKARASEAVPLHAKASRSRPSRREPAGAGDDYEPGLVLANEDFAMRVTPHRKASACLR
jgi:hypothetical protein